MTHTLGGYAYLVKAHLPILKRHSCAEMAKHAETLANNLMALMRSRKITSDAGLAKLANVDQKTIWRIRHHEQSPTVDKLESIAQAFGLHVWQLLIPDLDPNNPPVFVMSDSERNFYSRLTEMAKEFAAHESPKKYGKQ